MDTNDNVIKLSSYHDKIQYIDSQGNTKSINPTEILRISNINNLAELANNYFLVSSLCETVNKQVKGMQKELDEIEGTLFIQYSYSPDKIPVKLNGKKPTKDAILGWVHNDENYRACKQQLIDLQSRYNILNNLMKAIVIKKDLLQTLNSNARVERQFSSTNGFVQNN